MYANRPDTRDIRAKVISPPLVKICKIRVKGIKIGIKISILDCKILECMLIYLNGGCPPIPKGYVLMGYP